MITLKQQQARIKNFTILRLRGAWSLFSNIGQFEICEKIDEVIKEYGAEPESTRREKRLNE